MTKEEAKEYWTVRYEAASLKDRLDVHISEHVLQSKANRQRPMHMTHLADCGKKGEKGGRTQ